MQSITVVKDVTRQDQINIGFAVSHLKALFAQEEKFIQVGVQFITKNAHLRSVNKHDPETLWNDLCNQGRLPAVSEEITEWLMDFPTLRHLHERRQNFWARQKTKLTQALRPYQQAKRGYYQTPRHQKTGVVVYA